MKGSIPRSHRFRLQPGVNLTPMLDMIFNLLFFFILTTTVRDNTSQMKVELPQVRTGGATGQVEQLPVLTLDRTGQVWYMDRKLGDDELQLEMSALASQGTRQVRLRSDREVILGRVAEIMDRCQVAGIASVKWDVQSPGGSSSAPPLPPAKD